MRKIKQKHLLLFHLCDRTGPGYTESTLVMNNMRVYLVLGWLKKASEFLAVNPDPEYCAKLKSRTLEMMTKYGQSNGSRRGQVRVKLLILLQANVLAKC